MTLRPAVFAIPGDIDTKTGGYIYEKQVLLALRAAGREVRHLQLPGGFPHVDAAAMAEAVAALTAIPQDRVLILDGLVYGAIDTAGLARVRAPIVAMIHHPLALETGLPEAEARHLFVTERDNLRLAAQVVVPSPHTAGVLVNRYDVPKAKIRIALPGFPAPDPVKTPADPPLILSVGSLVPRKGHDVLIAALATLTDLPWQARIAGARLDEATATELQAQVTEAGLEGRLNFLGPLDEAALTAQFRSAHLFALASRYEGYGMVFAEALTHGLPIVCCRGGAIPDTVPEAAGLLVEVDDTPAFAAALRALLADPALHADKAGAAARAGAALPRWADTAAVMAAAVEAA